jgi:hypothetical protein
MQKFELMHSPTNMTRVQPKIEKVGALHRISLPGFPHRVLATSPEKALDGLHALLKKSNVLAKKPGAAGVVLRAAAMNARAARAGKRA